MARKPAIYVTRKGNAWDVKQGGTPFPYSSHKTQEAAIDSATPIAKAQQTELRIQGKDRKIRKTMSYGNDPFPPRDRD